MSEIQYKRYLNVLTFAKDWRKYQLVSNLTLTDVAFRNEMQTNQYVLINCEDPKKKKDVYIYLLDKESKYFASSTDLKALLDKIKKPCIVILITYLPFSTYGRKVIAKYKHITIKTYRHEIFDLIVPNGPLCYPHRIMSKEEVLHLCNKELSCMLPNIPKIFDEDPQCIWNGAEVGDVVEIKMLSDISGETVYYRVVVPKSGRVISSKETFASEVVDTDKAESDDEEVIEYRENAQVNDISDDDDADDESVSSEIISDD